jgi:hypothetical protein
MFYTEEEIALCSDYNTGRILVKSAAYLVILHDNLMFVIFRRLCSLDFCCVTSIYSILSSILYFSEEIKLCLLEHCYGPRILIIARVLFQRRNVSRPWTLQQEQSRNTFSFEEVLIRRHIRISNACRSPNNDTIWVWLYVINLRSLSVLLHPYYFIFFAELSAHENSAFVLSPLVSYCSILQLVVRNNQNVLCFHLD